MVRPRLFGALDRAKALVVLVTVWKARMMVGKEGKRIERDYMCTVGDMIWKRDALRLLQSYVKVDDAD